MFTWMLLAETFEQYVLTIQQPLERTIAPLNAHLLT